MPSATRELVIAAAAVLRGVEHDVRVFEQLFRIGTGLRIHADSDARHYRQCNTIDDERYGKRPPNPFGDGVDGRGVGQHRGDYDEFVAARAHDDIVSGH